MGSSEPGTPQRRSIWSCYKGTNNVITFLSFGTFANWIRCQSVLASERACVRACLIGSHQKTLSSETRTRFWKVQSGTLTPCLAAPCLRQSNTPSHVVCCHGSRDPSHSVCKNIVLVSHPPDPTPPSSSQAPPLAEKFETFLFFF